MSEQHEMSSPGGSTQETPKHLRWLNTYRTEKCSLFDQKQCEEHRPYTCFFWHYPSQRRRRPILLADGTFNYSPDVFCNQYDTETGRCPNGDSCRFLHRVTGDTERKYHPRYFKTAQCVHPTNYKGYCVKNGPSCAYAHGPHDTRHPTFEKPLKSTHTAPADIQDTYFCKPGAEWQSQEYILEHYKTDKCKITPYMCRQGYSCPFWHSFKDKRRCPDKYNYRSTPCPAVKIGAEWSNDPDVCHAGDSCGYCHSRTEQQFHEDFYKTSRCNDMLEHGFCPRHYFCAFAHSDLEEQGVRSARKKPKHETCRINFERTEQPRPRSNTVGPMSPVKEMKDPRSSLFTTSYSSLFGVDSAVDLGQSFGKLDDLHLDLQMMEQNGNYSNMVNEVLSPALSNMMSPGPSSSNHQPPQFENLAQRCQYLEGMREQEMKNATIWKALFEKERMKNTWLQEDREHLLDQIKAMEMQLGETYVGDNMLPLQVKLPEEHPNIRPSASLPNSPSYNIFVKYDDDEAPVCAQCGRTPPPPGFQVTTSCTLCKNHS
ncbi:hypothetical protein CRE_14465 [Caenorhabditis remanei]|uniref:C3H1-type domain-containing protein n=1 Tax=Caenorhabditis remanei TaxID=31234 RepID=E3M919_CAERE|nr:hypothetical protein CRE_14465 [Caenorhabditis remanei]